MGVGGDKLWSERGGNDLTLTLGETCSGEGGGKSQGSHLLNHYYIKTHEFAMKIHDISFFFFHGLFHRVDPMKRL